MCEEDVDILDVDRIPMTPEWINKMTELVLLDAYTRAATLMRWVVSDGILTVFATVNSVEQEFMKPPLRKLEPMLAHLRGLCGIDEETSEGSVRFDQSEHDVKHTLFKISFSDSEIKGGGKLVCEITLVNTKPG